MGLASLQNGSRWNRNGEHALSIFREDVQHGSK